MSATVPEVPTAAPVIGQVKGMGARLGSIDAFRGFVMLLMLSEVLEVDRVAAAWPQSKFWAFLNYEQSHVEWIGCSLHDLIQPGFSFLVGVAMPFSLARRTLSGQAQWQLTLHAFWRAMVLICLGIFIRSIDHPQTYWTFKDTLTQIGLGYGFLYLIASRSVRLQWTVLAGILAGYWLAFALYPLPGHDFNWAAAGTSLSQQLPGFAGHWSLNTNLAWAFDRWFLNLFPQEHPFQFADDGGYSTLNFIPTLATMILGLIAGGWLHSGRAPDRKLRRLVITGVVTLFFGWLLGVAGICPVVKRIWTPGWVLFSGGWCLLILAGFYLVIDIWQRRCWDFPLKVVGMNSIAAYLISWLFVGFIQEALVRHIGAHFFEMFGQVYQPALLGLGVMFVEWLLLWWLYQRKIFLRV